MSDRPGGRSRPLACPQRPVPGGAAAPGPAGESAATGVACRCGQVRRHRHGFPGPAALHRRGGPLRRAAGWALAVVLAGLGSLGGLLGAGLSLTGLCCGGPALTAAGAAAGAAAPGEPMAAWLLPGAGAALLTAGAAAGEAPGRRDPRPEIVLR